MNSRAIVALSFVAALILPGLPAQAAEQPFTAAAMQAAQAQGKPIVVHVTASWCTTCAAQKPIVQSLLHDPKFKGLTVFDVDFDKQKATLRQYGVRMQSTFIAFKGKDEVGRSTGDTSKASIETLFDKAS